MIERTQYIVDAFTNSVFGGNSAAVCLLPDWIDENLLAGIALENNLAETAFLVGGNGTYEIRWFTPAVEVDLCGHATLSSAFVVLTFLEPHLDSVVFHSKSGQLSVLRDSDLFVLDFPTREGKKVECPSEIIEGLGLIPRETFLARDFLCILESQDQVASCNPTREILQKLPSFGIIISAPGDGVDFVSRVFFPNDTFLEDPVTGSAHCTLIPYWAKRLNKKKLHARQISARSGELFCTDLGDRVHIAGNAVLYSKSVIFLPMAVEQNLLPGTKR